MIKILVIDDIPDNLISLKAQIADAFPEAIIITALNGANGIELAAVEDPDVILLDIVMPGMDGYEVCQLLKADQKLSNIPVIFVTAIRGDKENRIRALECGAEALLAKPLDQSELIAQIRAMVKIKSANTIKQNEKERLTQLVDEQVRELQLTHTATLNLLEDLKNENEIRKRSEEALKRSIEQYHALTQSTNDAIITINGDGIVTGWNNGAEKMFGYSEEEITGKKSTLIMPLQYRELHYQGINRVLGGGNHHMSGKTAELVGLDRNGTEFPIELSLSEWGTATGKYFTGIIRDISERKQVENKIREKDVQFRKLLSNVPDMVFQFTRRPDGTYCVPVASEGIRNIFGCSPEDVADDFTPIGRILFPEDSARVISEIEYSAKFLIYFTCEFRVQIPGREIRWIYSRSTPEKLPDSSITWYGFNMDITKQKQAEFLLLEKATVIETQNIEYQQINEELIQTNQKLTNARNRAENNEARLKMAQKVSKSGSWEWDIQKNIFYWSDEFLQLFGLPENTIAGFKALTKAIHPEDVEIATRSIQETIDTRTELLSDYRIILPNNEIRWIRTSGHTIYVDDKPAKMIGMSMDITSIKEKETELQDARLLAEESDKLKSAFLANMSHEIRTPMNGIIGFAELLKEPDLDGEQQQEYIRIIEKSGTRMLNIINDIIDISKIESQQMKVSVSVTNINDKVEYIHTFFKPETDKKGLEFRFKKGLPEKEANILTDREKIYAIMTNLVKNAIKFCDTGSIEIGYNLVETHGLETHCRASLLRFYVKDTGIGIPIDRQEAIFDRFVQADISDKRAFQGAGLGLSISKAYVEMLGGKIWVESEVGKGSTFYFTLPYRTEREEENVTENIFSVKDAIVLLKKLNVLIAEDDEVSERLIEVEVRKFSKNIFKAKTGFEAIEVCHNHPDIDLVLMDIKMPGMDGYEATRQIRKFNKNVFIVAQTAYALAGDSEKAIKFGCNDYISKPINTTQFQKIIQKHFQNQN